eukprot:CAMPEP_0202915370 /NCGR_PEP_ID=MMETSP1392-20130828/65511_1 /ASSEMBLY_ACC=CAM_ASM_000868 /TAXON_ID=225041 /ORGANISM="Chlamydomonas chlamydogama, Strain SAG 11-48b" /LENGTH=66 /DNA_ID=CAMNT_0049607367 /DNA_START=370 /DNA_END=570 /DNA_ORIENTATION=-
MGAVTTAAATSWLPDEHAAAGEGSVCFGQFAHIQGVQAEAQLLTHRPDDSLTSGVAFLHNDMLADA